MEKILTETKKVAIKWIHFSEFLSEAGITKKINCKNF